MADAVRERTLSARLVAAWYRPRLSALTAALVPLALVFGLVAALRRRLFRLHLRRVAHLPVPVVVVGNLTVGGTGKTPLVRALVAALRARGFHPGVVSRGHGRRTHGVRAVTAGATAADVGDEPLLLAMDGTPVTVGEDRVAAARALLASHRDVDVLISDDGLQHYRLGRSVEIVAVDAARGFGNGWLLPAGPLREPLSRGAKADALVWTGSAAACAAPAALASVPAFAFAPAPAPFQPLVPGTPLPALAELAPGSVHALAGIASPERFFTLLAELGIRAVPHAFTDHHDFRPGDLDWPGAAVLLMTEKDAVKCRAFADARMFCLPLAGVADSGLVRLIEDRLRGRQAA